MHCCCRSRDFSLLSMLDPAWSIHVDACTQVPGAALLRDGRGSSWLHVAAGCASQANGVALATEAMEGGARRAWINSAGDQATHIAVRMGHFDAGTRNSL